jgi:hypothetical protein
MNENPFLPPQASSIRFSTLPEPDGSPPIETLQAVIQRQSALSSAVLLNIGANFSFIYLNVPDSPLRVAGIACSLIIGVYSMYTLFRLALLFANPVAATFSALLMVFPVFWLIIFVFFDKKASKFLEKYRVTVNLFGPTELPLSVTEYRPTPQISLPTDESDFNAFEIEILPTLDSKPPIEKLKAVAQRQKLVKLAILAIVIRFVVECWQFGSIFLVSDGCRIVWFAIGLFAMYATFRLANLFVNQRLSAGYAILALMPINFISLIGLVLIHHRANAFFKRFRIRPGFFGPNLASIKAIAD